MASKASSSLALFFILILVLFTIAASCGTCPGPNPKPKPKPKPNPKPSPSPSGKCPIDTLKLGSCADVLGLISWTIGEASKTPCCTLINGGLTDVEAAVCLCTALKANVIGIHLNVPVNLSLLLNFCGKKVPSGFQCP